MRDFIVGLVSPTMALLFAGVFLLLWWSGRIGRHALAFGIAYALLAIGLITVHFQLLPDVVTFHFTQLLYSIGAMLIIWGAAQRVGVRVDLRMLAIPYVCCAIALTVLLAQSPNAGPLLVMTNIGYGVMFVIGAMALANAPRQGPFDMLVIVMLVINAIDFLIRPTLTTLAEEAFFIADYRQSLYYSVINLALSIKTAVTAFVLIGACLHDMVENMRTDSARDSMTGLLSRRAFEEEVHSKLAVAAKLQVPLSLVVADIDHFKKVNDIWGHLAGDQAIAGFGRLISRMVRGRDVCGRIGGEEFCILIWDCPNDAALKLAERIRAKFAQMEHEGISDGIRLSASFGVATLEPGESYHGMFARADAALYCAKEGGRNRVCAAGEDVLPDGRRRADVTAEDFAQVAA